MLLCARRMPGQGTGGIERWTSDVRDTLARRHDLIDLAHHGGRWKEPWYLGALAGRIRRASRHWPDAIADGSDASLAWSLARSRVPCVLRVQGLDLLYPHTLYQQTLRRGLPDISAFVACSQPTADLLRQRGIPDERIHVVYPPAEVPPDHLPDPRPGRLLMVGRLVARKGIVPFVEDVWPRIQAARPDARLDIVGDGPEARLLAAALRGSSRATWHGWLDQERLEARFRSADLFIMNNQHLEGDWEGFGIVAAEAAVRGVPVVARAVDGVVDAVVDGVTGCLVEPDQDMADAVVAAMDQTWRRGRVAHAARRRYGRKRHDREYLAVHDQMV